MDNNDKNGFGGNLTPEEERMARRMAEKNRERAMQKQQAEKRKAANAEKVNKIKKISLIAVIIAALLSLVVVAVCYARDMTLNQLFTSVTSRWNGFGIGGGYPYDVEGGKVIDMQTMKGETVLLKSESVVILNGTAKTVADVPHTYASPLMKINGDKIFVCDTVSGRYMIMNRNGVIKSGDSKSTVHTIAIGPDNLTAFSLPGEGASSVLSVYSNWSRKLFDFKCGSEYITSVAFSTNGKYVALIGVGSKQASIYSKIYIIDVDSYEKPVKELTYEDTALIGVYPVANNFVAVGETECILISNAKKVKKIEPEGGTISHFVGSTGGSFALAVSKYGALDSATVKIYSPNGNERHSCEIPSNAELVCFDGDVLSVFGGDNVIYSFSASGRMTGRYKLDTNAQRLCSGGRYCYALNFDRVLKVSTHKDTLRDSLKDSGAEDKEKETSAAEERGDMEAGGEEEITEAPEETEVTL